MAAPKGPQHDPLRGFAYEAILPKRERVIMRPGKTAEDRLPVSARPRVRRFVTSLPPGLHRSAYLREMGIEDKRLANEAPQRQFPTLIHPGVVRL